MHEPGRLPMTLLLAAVLVAVCAPAASAVTLQMLTRAWWLGPEGWARVTDCTPIDTDYNPYIRYDVAVEVSEGDNMGLASIEFDVTSPEAVANGYVLTPFYDAEGGYTNTTPTPEPRSLLWPAYDTPQPNVPPAAYDGGWGLNNSGFPTGGTATAPGQVHSAGNSMPLIWSGDNAPNIPGLQPYALLHVGQQYNIGRPEDPVLAGTMLGWQGPPHDGTPDWAAGEHGIWPQDFGNSGTGVGYGEWVMFHTYLDVSGWADGCYHINIEPTVGEYLLFPQDFTGDSAGLTYYDELSSGYRGSVSLEDMSGESFSFIIPEPTGVGLLALGGLALLRRRS